MDFAAGDRVQLKSGGTIMTVETIEGDNITCVWNHDGQTHRDTYVAGTLEKYTPGLDSAMPTERPVLLEYGFDHRPVSVELDIDGVLIVIHEIRAMRAHPMGTRIDLAIVLTPAPRKTARRRSFQIYGARYFRSGEAIGAGTAGAGEGKPRGTAHYRRPW